jgi:hypothetical protein
MAASLAASVSVRWHVVLLENGTSVLTIGYSIDLTRYRLLEYCVIAT